MIPEAALVVKDGNVYLNGRVVAIVTGPEDQVTLLRKAPTEKEALMNSLNARLRTAK